MPKLDGFGATRAIRACGIDTPIVEICGRSDRQAIQPPPGGVSNIDESIPILDIAAALDIMDDDMPTLLMMRSGLRNQMATGRGEIATAIAADDARQAIDSGAASASSARCGPQGLRPARCRGSPRGFRRLCRFAATT